MIQAAEKAAVQKALTEMNTRAAGFAEFRHEGGYKQDGRVNVCKMRCVYPCGHMRLTNIVYVA